MIRASTDFGVETFRVPGKTGIWVRAGATEEKLGAIGVHISRWVTSHGFAYNVSTDLRYFDLIVPCGIADRKTTSLEKLLQGRTSLTEVQPHIVGHLAEAFSLSPRSISRSEFLTQLTQIEAASAAPE